MILAFIKQSFAGLLFVGLLLILGGKADAQQLYQPAPAMRISKSGIVDQLVNGSTHESRGNSQQPEMRDSQAEFAQQAIYEKTSPEQEDWDLILNATPLARNETLTTKNEPRSFIERETQDAETRESAQDLVKRISINLAFVLAIAFGFILLARQWQKSKLIQHTEPTADVNTLAVKQVLSLTNGASLHVVEGFGNKCLVAIDASGIKSVNVLTPTFEETLEQTDASEEAVDFHTPEPIVADQSTSEIDENLIKLLLRSSKKAA